MTRLTYDDDLFLRMECVLGVPVVNQIVWRFDRPVSDDALTTMWSRLVAGPINRTVHRVGLPGARDKWVRATQWLPLDVGDAVIAGDAVDVWMEQQASIALDPIDGPVWNLATATVDDGGSVVSLVASHVVGDGGALTSVAIAALSGDGDPDDFRSAFEDPIATDVRDSVSRIGSAAAGATRALARTASAVVRRAPKPAAVPAPSVGSVGHSGPQASGDFTPSTIVVDCPTAQWAEVATNLGGSANSLLVAVALGILDASGRIRESDTVKVSLPVSTRMPGDTRANATSGVSIHVEGGGGYRSDLRAVRRDSKAAFSTLADPNHVSTFELTKPLMQMLPDLVVAKAAASATAPLCLCSNLGDRGVSLRSVGGVDARSVAMRSITQNTTAELLRRTRGGVSVWWNTSGPTATLCVTGLDPDRFPSRDHLRSLVEAEYERWQLTSRFW